MKKIKLKRKVNKVKKENITTSQFKKNWQKGNIFEKILIVIMLILVSGFACGLAFFIYVVIAAPKFDPQSLYTKEASILFDSKGEELARLGTENRQKVTYDELPEVFIDALVATEDSRYFQHSGVDMARFLKATIGQVFGQSGAGGASTLTMQVAKQRLTNSEASGIKGIIRKFTDVYLSVFVLEKKYSKEQLIEFYVNIPYLGSGSYGIEQASQVYFGKSASELSLPEAATIAGLFQAPVAYDPFDYPEKAEARRNQVLNLMKRHGYISEEECEIAKSIPLKSLLVESESTTNQYQGFIDTVVEEVIDRTGKNPYETPMSIKTTMVREKQEAINSIYNGTTYKWLNDTVQAGIAVVDNDNGSLIAVGAGRNRKRLREYNYATMIKRHPGSTAKPIFDYGPAIEYLNWSTGKMIIDDKYTYSGGGYLKNWDNSYKGIMTIETALGSSRNIPALQAFQAVSQSQIKTFVTNLGITPEYENGFINEAHSIGGFNGTNPLEMAAAYATFARGGIYIEPYSFTSAEFLDTGEVYTVTPEKRTVMSEATAYMINIILRNAVTNNYVSAGSKSGTDIASKTGTSTIDSKYIKSLGIKGDVIGDSWQMVYSPDYTIGLWIGYKETTKETYLLNSDAGKIKKPMVRQLIKDIFETNSRWKQPSSVVTAEVELGTEPLALASAATPSNLRTTAYFKKGTVPSEESFRFSQLENPTNLKANYLLGAVELSWEDIATPKAIDEAYLKEYFDEGYKPWSEKYYEERITYNANNIGTNGYHVYITVNGNTTDLGFTTNNKFTYTGLLSSKATFTIKSAYSKFKNNMSSGVSVTVNPDGNSSSTGDVEITLNGNNTMTVSGYYDMINNDINKSPVKVTNNGVDVTNQAVTKNYCSDQNNNSVDCKSLDCTSSYTIIHNVTYNGKTKSFTRTLTNGC